MNTATSTDLSEVTKRLRASRDRGVGWLLDHIAADGEPVGARERNGWARVPWALALSGETDAAHALVSWAERGQLAPGTGFAPGVAQGAGMFTGYPLAHLAIGCWLLERFSAGLGVMEAIRAMQDTVTGGIMIAQSPDLAGGLSDLLQTAQAGLAAVITGQDDIADLAYRWVAELYRLQPHLSEQKFYTFRRGPELVIDLPQSYDWVGLTHFDRPKQSFYTPGMAAVFLAAYAQTRQLDEPLMIASDLMKLNIEGTEAQFTDLESVQACKFGWGAAAMLVAQPDADWLRHVVWMVDWFIARQAQDGSWAVSTFLNSQPSDIDRLVKTSEHVMEINAMLAALGVARGRAG